MIPLEDPTSLSLLFHLNSEPWLNDEAYRSAAGPQEFKRPDPILSEVSLPPSSPSALTETIRRRRSCRAFADKVMPLGSVSSLLDDAYGIVDATAFGDRTRFLRRAVPSAGGLFPLELYVLLRRVDGLEDGLYHYDVLGHSVRLMRQGDLFSAIEPMFYTYPFIRDANLIIAIAAVFRRMQKKYGPRGYRYILIESGHVGQNVCLRASELGLATLCMGGFVDSELNALLGLAPTREGVVYTVAVGYDAERSSE
jgi:SagB-type dehydrogenase family enzyme